MALIKDLSALLLLLTCKAASQVDVWAETMGGFVIAMPPLAPSLLPSDVAPPTPPPAQFNPKVAESLLHVAVALSDILENFDKFSILFAV